MEESARNMNENVPQSATSVSIDAEYKRICMELGQLTLQRMDFGEQIAQMDTKIANYRATARKLAADYSRAVTQEKLNGDAPV